MEYVWLIILFNCLRKLIVLAHLLKFIILGSFFSVCRARQNILALKNAYLIYEVYSLLNMYLHYGGEFIYSDAH